MKKIIYSFLLITCFLAVSCKKDTNVFIPDPGQQLDSAWTANVTAASQVMILSKKLEGSFVSQEFNTLSDTSVTTSNGLQFSFPKNSLLLNGSSLSGSVKLEYVLLQKKGDFIRYGVPTSSSRYPLESGGALHIRLTSGGQPVTVASNQKISIRYSDPLPKANMSVFYGSPDIVTNSLLFNWTLATDNSNVKLWDSINTYPAQKGYALETFRTGWVSINKSLETSLARVEIRAVLPDLFSNANTAVYMVFKNFRSVLQLSGNTSSRDFSFPNIPVGQEVTFVTISKVGDSLYLGIKTDKTVANMVSFIKPELSSLSSIMNYLNSL